MHFELYFAMSHVCTKCSKPFSRKPDLTRHLNRKVDCSGKTFEEKVKEQVVHIIEEKIEEKLNEIKEEKSTDIIVNLANKLHNYMRNNNQIVGHKAYPDIIRLLFIYFIQSLIQPGKQLETLLNPEDYKVNGEYPENFEEVNLTYLNIENLLMLPDSDESFETMLKKIWKRVLAKHHLTKIIFQESDFFKVPSKCIRHCFMEIRHTLIKVKFDELNNDFKGVLYEHFLNGYASNGGKEFGQYFTPRNMLNLILKLNKDYFPNFKPKTIYDPCAGTAGFLCEMYKQHKDTVNPENIHGGELEADTYTSALMNLILTTNSIGKVKKCDSLSNNENILFDYIGTNPPFGMKGIKYKKIINEPMFNCVPGRILDDEIEVKSNGILMSNMYPFETNDGCALFLQHCIARLAQNGVCSIVLPDGQILLGKSYMKLRKYLIETCNVKAVINAPSGTFTHAGVKTAILIFTKGTKTEKIDFYQTDQKCSKCDLIDSVDYNQLVNNKYIINYNKYKVRENLFLNDEIEIKKLGEICEIIKGPKHNVSEGQDEPGENLYPLICSSNTGKVKWMKTCDYKEQYIIFGTGGEANVHLYEKFNISNHAIILKPIKDNIKYIYYYLKSRLKNITDDHFDGATIKNITVENLLSINIPVYTLDLQQQIIDDYEVFEKLKNIIKEKNNLIEQQMAIYERRYLKPLFNQKNKENIKKLSELCQIKAGKFNSYEKKEEGLYPFYSGVVDNPSGYSDKYCFDYPEYIILIKDGGSGDNKYGNHIGLGMPFLVSGKSAATSHQVAIIPNNTVLTKYLYYYLLTNKNNTMDLANYTTGLGCISMSSINDIQIPVPSLEVQQTIIDNFSDLTEKINANNKEPLDLYDNLQQKLFYINQDLHI